MIIICIQIRLNINNSFAIHIFHLLYNVIDAIFMKKLNNTIFLNDREMNTNKRYFDDDNDEEDDCELIHNQ